MRPEQTLTHRARIVGMPSRDEPLLRALAEARALGFLGPGPVDDHLVSARAFLEGLLELDVRGPGLDLGSGGGVPGLALATWLPDWEWVLLDGQRRRSNFLSRAVVALDLVPRVTVVRERAEVAGHRPEHRGRFGCVTARSFGAPPATAEAAAGFLRVGGVLFVAEPPSADGRWDTGALRHLGLQPRALSGTRRAMTALEQVEPCPREFPRSWPRQRRRPLF